MQARITTNDDDTFLQMYLDAATASIQEQTGLFLLNHTVYFYPTERVIFGRAPAPSHPFQRSSAEIVSWEHATQALSRGPLRAITALEYTPPGATDYVAVDPSHYSAVISEEPGRLWLSSSFSRPALSTARQGAIRITATVGYGATAASVPAALRNAVAMLAAYFYDNRGGGTEFPLAVTHVINNHKLVTF